MLAIFRFEHFFVPIFCSNCFLSQQKIVEYCRARNFNKTQRTEVKKYVSYYLYVADLEDNFPNNKLVNKNSVWDQVGAIYLNLFLICLLNNFFRFFLCNKCNGIFLAITIFDIFSEVNVLMNIDFSFVLYVYVSLCCVMKARR